MSITMPDVCMTPPFAIPTPFPNIANNALAIPGYYTIMINGMPELNTASQYAINFGDEAGALGEVASGTVVGPGRPMMGSAAYSVGGLRVGVATLGRDCTALCDELRIQVVVILEICQMHLC